MKLVREDQTLIDYHLVVTLYEEKLATKRPYCYYSMTELVDWLKEFQKHAHNPPTMGRPAEDGGMDLCMTNGVQEGLGKVLH